MDGSLGRALSSPPLPIKPTPDTASFPQLRSLQLSPGTGYPFHAHSFLLRVHVTTLSFNRCIPNHLHLVHTLFTPRDYLTIMRATIVSVLGVAVCASAAPIVITSGQSAPALPANCGLVLFFSCPYDLAHV